MNTTELYESVAEAMEISKAESGRMVRAFFKEIQDLLEKDESVSIPDLGTFDTHKKDSRKVYNPHYEAYLKIPPRKVVDFRPAKSLKDSVADTEVNDE